MKRRPFIFVGLVTVMVGFLLAQRAAALTISPPTFEVMAKPGEVKTLSIRVINDQSAVVTLFTSTANFKAQGETGQPDFLFDVQTVDLASWIKPEKANLTLQPDESAFMPFTITVPANAEPGGHYAGLFFGTGAPQADAGQVGVESKLGALIIVSVEGNIRESAQIKELAVEQGQKRSHLPVDFRLRIENIGNVHVRPKGFLTIRNMFGGVAATLSVNPKEGAALPGSTRRFDLTWKRTESGSGNGLFAELREEWKNFALGTYSAEAVVTYGENEKTLTATTSFAVFPWLLLTIVFIVLVVFIFLVVKGIKAYNRMIIRRAQGRLGRSTSGENKLTK